MLSSSSFKVGILLDKIKQSFSIEGFKHLVQNITSIGQIPNNSTHWFDDGVNCEFLEPNKDWKKGKVKIKVILEFYFDEPDEKDLVKHETNINDSPLDEIRQSINQVE